MKCKFTITPPGQVLVIIGTALLVQLLGRYHAGSLVLGGYFYLSWVILRIVVPLACIFLLSIPLSEMGLGLPRFDRTVARMTAGIVLILLIAFCGIYFLKGYIGFYSGSFMSKGYGPLSRFSNFMVFTGSTLTGWEFLHRSFLLMGIYYILKKVEDIPPAASMALAIGIVWVFEVAFHFIKPELEALGLLVGSPVLSYLAIRTRSLWLSFFIHFLVELLFIFVVIIQ